MHLQRSLCPCLPLWWQCWWRWCWGCAWGWGWRWSYDWRWRCHSAALAEGEEEGEAALLLGRPDILGAVVTLGVPVNILLRVLLALRQYELPALPLAGALAVALLLGVGEAVL